MSTPTVSIADMLEIQLRKWMSKHHVSNIKLSPSYSHPSVPAGEAVIAEVIDRSAQALLFTSSGFTLPSRGFIYYDDIVTAKWISSQPDRLARKREDYDHIEFTLRDGSSVTLTDVEQAVFPLLHFFQWMTERRRHAG
jgi:hypothetical protein